MISIIEMFEDNMISLQEILVDHVFKDLSQILTSDKITLEDFYELERILKSQHNIILDLKRSPDNMLHGEYERPNKIVLYIPKSDNISNKEVVNLILHEFSHYLTDHKLPKLIHVKLANKNQIIPNILPPKNNVVFEEEDKSKIKKYIDYVLSIRERPNFAFSISLSMRDYNQPDIYQKNRKNIIEYFQNQNENYYTALNNTRTVPGTPGRRDT